jgi:hypothetical protein
MDMLLPTRMKARTLIELPKRAMALMERAEPRCTSFITDTDAPSFARQRDNNEKPPLALNEPRMEILDPIAIRSKQDTWTPNRPPARCETAEPMCSMSITENTLSLSGRTTRPNTEQLEELFTCDRIDRLEPSAKKLSTERPQPTPM